MTTALRSAPALPLLVATAFALAACGPQPAPPAASPGPAATAPAARPGASPDWAGYYHGTVPCASCPGIETWLHLDEADGGVRYELVENYLDEADGHFASAGEARWIGDGKALALEGESETRVLAVDEAHVVFLAADADAGAADSAYRLARLESYTGQGRQLLVDPAAIETETHPGSAPVLSFDALINFEPAAQDGSPPGPRSLRAHFVLDCASGELEMPTARYYSEPFASGEVLEAVEDLDDNTVEIGGEDEPLRQFGAQHCDDADLD